MNSPHEAETVLSVSEVERYEAAWQQYRVYSARYWLFLLGYIPAVLFFGWLLSFVFSDNLAHGIAIFSWMGVGAVTGQGYRKFLCPRCGNRYFVVKGTVMTTNLTNKCLNCGLPKYAYDRTVVKDEF